MVVLLCQHILYDAIVFFFVSNSRARTLHAFTYSFIHSHIVHTICAKSTSNFKMLKISAAVAPILFLCIREFHALNYLPVFLQHSNNANTLTLSHTNSAKEIKSVVKMWIEHRAAMMMLVLVLVLLVLFKRMTMWTHWTLFRNYYCTWLLQDILCSMGTSSVIHSIHIPTMK